MGRDLGGTLIVFTDERTEEVGALFASGRAAIEKLNASYSEKELELVAAYFKRLVNVWEEQRKERILK
jgi:hypothetical protein